MNAYLYDKLLLKAALLHA